MLQKTLSVAAAISVDVMGNAAALPITSTAVPSRASARTKRVPRFSNYRYCRASWTSIVSSSRGIPRGPTLPGRRPTKPGEMSDRNANGAERLNQSARGRIAYVDASTPTPFQNYWRSP